MEYEEKLARLRMIRTKNIGPVTFSILLNRYGNAINALDALPDLTQRSGVKNKIASKASIEAEIEKAESVGAFIVVRGEENYPKALFHFDDAPGCLTMLGHHHLGQKSSLAMVGSRNASLNALAFSENLADQIGRRGFVVVSGLARGIDAACHHGALPHGTVAVTAGGIDQIYPRENEALFKRIAAEGLIVTEMPFGMAATARLFPIRNRLIASMSLGTIVVEASLRSGSLITARDANERGRDVMAIPGNPMDERSSGCNSLIKDGAHLIRNIDDIMEIVLQSELKMTMKTPSPLTVTISKNIDTVDISNAREIISSQLSFDATEVDELIRRCHLSASVVNAALLEMELAGELIRLFGNRVTKVYSP